jgi:hypothetical protein
MDERALTPVTSAISLPMDGIRQRVPRAQTAAAAKVEAGAAVDSASLVLEAAAVVDVPGVVEMVVRAAAGVSRLRPTEVR